MIHIQSIAGASVPAAVVVAFVMRLHPAIILFLTSIATLVALPASPEKPTAPPTARETALDRILTERGAPKALADAIATARKNGIGDQAVIEARFLYHVDRRDDAALVAMLPELLKQRELFKLEDSAIFAVKEDWLAIIEYVEALAALAKGDQNAFKQHITEAFWLSPRQAAAFTPHIERMRLDACMRLVKIDFTATFAPLLAGDPVALQQLIAKKNAMLFYFWSPRSDECVADMKDFTATADVLASNGIAVVAMTPADPPQLLTEARALIPQAGDKPSVTWLTDSTESPLARTLRIRNVPTMVLVANDGKIIFHGDPTATEFWEALHNIDARIKRPAAQRDNAQ